MRGTLRCRTDLVVALVQVAVLAHHKQGGHGTGQNRKVTATCVTNEAAYVGALSRLCESARAAALAS
jgi:hypothetical protein